MKALKYSFIFIFLFKINVVFSEELSGEFLVKKMAPYEGYWLIALEPAPQGCSENGYNGFNLRAAISEESSVLTDLSVAKNMSVLMVVTYLTVENCSEVSTLDGLSILLSAE